MGDKSFQARERAIGMKSEVCRYWASSRPDRPARRRSEAVILAAALQTHTESGIYLRIFQGCVFLAALARVIGNPFKKLARGA